MQVGAPHRQAHPWLLGDPPPVLSRPEGPYRRGETARTARHDSLLLLAGVYAQAGRLDGFPVVKDPLSRSFEKVGYKVLWQKLAEDLQDETFRFQVLDEGEYTDRDWRDDLKKLLESAM